MTTRAVLHRRRLPALIAVAAVAAVLGLAACGDPSSEDQVLTYSVTVRDGELTATVADNRPGDHTVWVVLLDPPEGTDREWFTATNHAGTGFASVTARAPLPPGSYAYAVYSTDGIVDGSGRTYWTAENLVAKDAVTVP
jgi:hypothetical protein